MNKRVYREIYETEINQIYLEYNLLNLSVSENDKW